MQKIKDFYFSYKKQIIIISIFALILLTIILGILFDKRLSAEEMNVSTENIEKQSSKIIEEDTIKIDIKGCITKPSVYELKKGSRVIDAINIAGGITENAYTRYINLSQILEDETIIIINSKEEIEKIKSGEKEEIICESRNEVCLNEEKIITNDITTNKKEPDKNLSSEKLNTFVNINKASKEELMTLNGIGESKAIKIIDYRNSHGNFKTIEEIKNVSGIGETIYAKIKENITV